MNGKLIRCICGNVYDPEGLGACPSCGRSHDAPVPPEPPSAPYRNQPRLWWIGGGALALLVIAFGVKQIIGAAVTTNTAPGDGGHTVTSDSPKVAANTVSPPVTDAAGDCAAVVGNWHWFTGGYVRFTGDGWALYATTPGGQALASAHWTCDAPTGKYTVFWPNGFTDMLSLAGDGHSLSGTNNVGVAISGMRYGD